MGLVKQQGFDGFGVPPPDLHAFYFALLPNAEIRARIDGCIEYIERRHPSAGTRVPGNRSHLTLKDVGASRRAPPVISAICAAIDTVRFAPFGLVLDVADSFDSAWWLGPGARPAPLFGLRAAIDAAIAARKLKIPKGSFTPHVSIRRGAGVRLPRTPIDPIVWLVDRFALVDSTMGGEQRIVREWRLTEG